MPARRSSKRTAVIAPVDPLERVGKLLALLLVKGESENDKIRTLAAVGYSASEIGTMLGKQANTVSVALYQARKSKGPKRR